MAGWRSQSRRPHATVKNWDEKFFAKNGNFEFMAVDGLKDSQGLTEVDYTAMGFMLVKRGIMGTCDQDYILKSSDGTDIDHLENSVVYQSGGRIGIGTTSPNATSKLHVKKTGSDPGTWYGRIIASGESAAVVMGEVNGKAWLGAHNAALSAWADLVMQGGGGNVGIGTTDPQSKLDVVGSGSGGGLANFLVESGSNCAVLGTTSSQREASCR